MAKKDNVSAFDELLGGITDESDRQALSGFAERYPVLRESVLRQSDYSRKSSELQSQREELEAQTDYLTRMREWQKANLVTDETDPNVVHTRAELEAKQEADRLKAEKAELEQRLIQVPQGDDVNLAELKAQLKSEILGEVNTTVSQKEAEFTKRLNGNSGVTMKQTIDTAKILMKHEKEFGESLDPDALWKAAADKGRYDLTDFYEKEYVADRRTQAKQQEYQQKEAAMKTDFEAKLAAQQKEFEERAEKLKGMGVGGPTPSEAGSDAMGPFQRQYLGLNQSSDGVSKNGVPDKARLGEGTIAAIAARNDMQKVASGL